MGAIKPDSNAQRVLAAVLDDPGVSARDISEVIDVPREQVSGAIAFLRRTNQIQNLGKHAKGASWYPTHTRVPDTRRSTKKT